MAFNQELEKRLKFAFAIYPASIKDNLVPKKMFGGLVFLFHGKMTVGIVKDTLMVRVIASKMEDSLATDHVQPMEFTKKPMKEFVTVTPEGIKTEEQLLHWIELGLEHAQTKINTNK